MTTLVLEQLSLALEEGVVAQWLVEDGGWVEKGQPVVEIETDKSTVEVEAPASGSIHFRAKVGAIVPVGATLAEIGEALAEKAETVSPRTAVESTAAAPPQPTPDLKSPLRVGCSPAARRLAQELGVDLGELVGSGPGGRIVASDVQRAATSASPAAIATARVSGQKLRELVVEAITDSWRTIPHIHVGGELVADGLAEAKRLAPEGTSITDLLVLAIVGALRDVPDLNGFVPGHTARPQSVNLAIAVATSDGIVAPVLRSADRLTIAEISVERRRLTEAARTGTLEKHDLGGATCTVSNLGAYPVDFFAPVVSGPQIALIATGRLAQRAVVKDGAVAVGHVLWVNAAIDHRGADGEAGGRFLDALETQLAELPGLLR